MVCKNYSRSKHICQSIRTTGCREAGAKVCKNRPNELHRNLVTSAPDTGWDGSAGGSESEADPWLAPADCIAPAALETSPGPGSPPLSPVWAAPAAAAPDTGLASGVPELTEVAAPPPLRYSAAASCASGLLWSFALTPVSSPGLAVPCGGLGADPPAGGAITAAAAPPLSAGGCPAGRGDPRSPGAVPLPPLLLTEVAAVGLGLSPTMPDALFLVFNLFVGELTLIGALRSTSGPGLSGGGGAPAAAGGPKPPLPPAAPAPPTGGGGGSAFFFLVLILFCGGFTATGSFSRITWSCSMMWQHVAPLLAENAHKTSQDPSPNSLLQYVLEQHIIRIMQSRGPWRSR